MNVFFDYQIFYFQKFGGISRYFLELARELNKLENCHSRIIAPYHDNEYLMQERDSEFIIQFNYFLRKTFYNRFVDRRIPINEGLTKYLCSKKSSLLHETYYSRRMDVKCRKVITIHDMIYELFFNQSDDEKELIKLKKQAILDADAIIAVSHNTKKDLINVYPQVAGKVFVVHHGVTHANPGSVTPYKHPRPFILFVGNRFSYKNFDRLLRVLASNTEISSEVDLIAFGGSVPDEKETELIRSLGITDKVFFLKGDDALLSSLYRSAEAFVYNSRYEGFGMPVLEAMQMGCPVICSSGSSLPEVAGDAAIMVDHDNEAQLSDAIIKLAGKPSQRKIYIDAGIRRAAEFSWKKCAIETKNVYSKVLNG